MTAGALELAEIQTSQELPVTNKRGAILVFLAN
jgi:hypothetical protein